MAGRGQPRRIAAEAADVLGQHRPVAGRTLELLRREVAHEAAAAREPALLVAPDRDLEGMAVAVALLAQHLRHLDRGHRAHVAVVVAAFGHGIDVRAEEDGGGVRVEAGPAAEDVPHGIDAHVQPRRAHHLHREGPPLDVGGREGHAAHSALRVGAEAREVLEAPLQPRRVHAPGAPDRLRGPPGAALARGGRAAAASPAAAARTKVRRSILGMAPSLLRGLPPGGTRARRRRRRRRDGNGGVRTGPLPATRAHRARTRALPAASQGGGKARANSSAAAAGGGHRGDGRLPPREEEDAAEGQARAARRSAPSRARACRTPTAGRPAARTIMRSSLRISAPRRWRRQRRAVVVLPAPETPQKRSASPPSATPQACTSMPP